MSMAAAILIASSGAAQATLLEVWGFQTGSPSVSTLSPSDYATGVSGEGFYGTGCSTNWTYYKTSTTDLVIRTNGWNVAYRNWDNAYEEPQYKYVSIYATAGYRNTLDSISFYIK